MKFMLCFRLRDGGSVEERVTAGEAAQKLLASWSPSDEATVHLWVQRCDGGGGYALVETDDEAALYSDTALWAPWLDIELVPVLDFTEATVIGNEALQKARSVF